MLDTATSHHHSGDRSAALALCLARVCVVADRRLIRVETLAELEALRLLYILGMRERQTTCFCGLFRLAMTASNAARSAVFSLIWVLSYIPQNSHNPVRRGILKGIELSDLVH